MEESPVLKSPATPTAVATPAIPDVVNITSPEQDNALIGAALNKTQATKKAKAQAKLEEEAPVEVENPATPVVEPTPVTPVAEPTKVDPEAEPEMVKLWETPTTPVTEATKTVTTTDTKAFDELQAKYDALLNDPSVALVLKSKQEGKDIFEIASTINSKNPASLSDEQVYKLMLADLNITTEEEIAEQMEYWESQPLVQRKAMIQPFRKELNNNYNNELKNLRVDYTPPADEHKIKEQKNFDEFQAIGQTRLNQLMFGNTLKYTPEVAKKTGDFMANLNLEQIHDAYVLAANFPAIQQRSYDAGFKAAEGTVVKEIQGKGIRQTASSPVIVKDESKQAKANALAKQIVEKSAK